MPLDALTLEKLDKVCLRFENQWQSGEPRSIESFMEGFSGEARQELLFELLLLDIDYRVQAGESTVEADYPSRFPEDQSIIDRALEGKRETYDLLESSTPDDRIFPRAERIDVAQEFQLKQLHAKGGIGVVYLARDEMLQRDVAVKFAKSGDGDLQEAARLRREAEITGRLEHPGIVPVYGVKCGADVPPCFVMQFVQGPTLRQAIRKLHQESSADDLYHRFAFRQLLQRLVAVCQAVSYAHGQNVIHRDIKPSNIMLGKFGETFLMDWGLAKIVGETEPFTESNDGVATEELVEDRVHEDVEEGVEQEGQDKQSVESRYSSTLPGRPIGTPEYASPEQIMGQVDRHNERSDVYSLGATLYALLTGKRSIEVEQLSDWSTADALKAITPPRKLDSRIPKPLELICCKAMAFDASSRYPTAEAFMDDLERYLADEPISLGRQPLISRCRRWAKRRPVRTTLAISMLVVIGLSALVVSALVGRTNRRLVQSNQALDRSNLKLQESQAETQDAIAEAVATLRSVTDKIVERSLSVHPTLSEEDRSYLEGLASRFERLSELKSDETEALHLKLEGLFRVGQLHHLLGRNRQAHDYLSRVTRWHETASVDDPALLELAAMARSRDGMVLIALGENSKAADQISKSNEVLEGLVKQFPKVLRYHLAYAKSFSELGTLAQYSELHGKAAEHFSKSLAITERLTATGVKSRRAMVLIGADRHNRGQALLSQRLFAPAEKEFSRAEEQYTRLVKAYPSAYKYQQELALIHFGLARTERNQKKRDLARLHIDSAIKAQKKLSESFPLVGKFEYQLGLSVFERGMLLKSMGTWAETLNSFEQAIQHVRAAIRKSESELMFHQGLFEILVHAGRDLLKAGDTKTASLYFNEAKQIAERRLHTRRVFRTQFDVARAQVAVAQLQIRTLEYREALKYFELAEKGLGDLTSQFDGKTRELRLFVHRGLGFCYVHFKRYSDAAPHWAKASRLAGKRDVTSHVMHIYTRAHDQPAESFAMLRSIKRGTRMNASDVFNLACSAAVVSRQIQDSSTAESAADLAFRFLDSAFQAGYFKNPVKVKSFQTNRSFRHLKDDERYAAFLSRVKAEKE